jgi:beta-glucosidase
VIDEIYNPQTQQYIQSVLATFGTTQDALLDVITGRFNPSGKMPFTTPISEEAAAIQLSDVPGNEEKKGYALFRFNEGISYKK